MLFVFCLPDRQDDLKRNTSQLFKKYYAMLNSVTPFVPLCVPSMLHIIVSKCDAYSSERLVSSRRCLFSELRSLALLPRAGEYDKRLLISGASGEVAPLLERVGVTDMLPLPPSSTREEGLTALLAGNGR